MNILDQIVLEKKNFIKYLKQKELHGLTFQIYQLQQKRAAEKISSLTNTEKIILTFTS